MGQSRGTAPLFVLNGSGNHQGGNAGVDGIGTGNGILSIGGGGNYDLTGDCGEQTGGLVVVVLHALNPGSTVESDSEGCQNGVE